MSFRIIIAYVIGVLAFPCHANAQVSVQRYVFRVITSDTRYYVVSGRSVYQTGFLMQGSRGILTALHGVAVGTKWSAINETGKAFTGLHIEKIDVDHDLVLLSSPALKKRGDGLLWAPAGKVKPLEKLRVFGHPAGISLYIKHPTAGDPPIVTLNRLIPPALFRDVRDRHSPAIGSKILSLEGKLGPGESGAPVLDSANRVVAVADGGLAADYGSISWAMPIPNMGTMGSKSPSQITSIFSKLLRNNTLDANVLFAFSVVTDREKIKNFDLDGLTQDIKAHENLPLTRYEVAAVIYHDIFVGLKKLPVANPANAYIPSDIRSDDPAYAAIKALLGSNAMRPRRKSNGKNPLSVEFDPDEAVDRYHLAALIYDFLSALPPQPKPDVSPPPSNSSRKGFEEFRDIPRDGWAYGYVNMLGQAGILEPSPDGFFYGSRPATYKQLKEIVSRIQAEIAAS